jgi:glycosyltransferase involved in cell wall biosynthesis
VLMDRLFRGVAETGMPVDLAYAAVGPDVQGPPAWATRSRQLYRRPVAFSRRPQVSWIVRASAQMWKLRRSPGIVHFHGIYAPNLFPALMASVARVPFAVLPVVEGGDLAGGGRLVRRLRRFVVRRSCVAFALSTGIARELAELGLDAARIVPLGNVVDIAEFRPASARTNVGAQPAGVVLGLIGRIGERKGAGLLVEALQSPELKDLGARLVLAGPPESDAFAEKMVEWSERQDIDVLGYVADVASVLRDRVDVFVLASRSEGLPGALVEAMACGLPCVVTNVGAMGQVVRDAGCGRVIEHSAAAIRDAVREIWSDPQLAMSMGANARAYAQEHYSVQAVAEQDVRGLGAVCPR